ncbi:MAG: hypothetical protein JXL84_14995 [Deltaproteobacteria bacterium]|nr:hypothetical protein [Deltaproteobacteria bacterium]
MANRKRLDSDTEAALAVVEMEKKQEELKRVEQEKREKAIAQCHEVIGRIQGIKMLSEFGDVASLMWLKEVKELKIYLDIPNIRTWESFCDYLKLDRRTVDEDLQNLRIFGENFLATVANLQVGYRELRKLRQISAAGDMIIDAEFAVIGEERIPLDADHAEDLEAAIESLLDSKNREIAEQKATIKAKERVLRDKEKKIEGLATEIEKLEGKARAKGHTPEEEAILRKAEDHKGLIDTLFLNIEPENFFPGDLAVTPRMKAAYVELLGFLRRTAEGVYQAGMEVYDDLDEEEWVQPES